MGDRECMAGRICFVHTIVELGPEQWLWIALVEQGGRVEQQLLEHIGMKGKIDDYAHHVLVAALGNPG